MQIPQALVLLELCLLISQLHQHTLMLSSLLLDLIAQLIVALLEITNLLVR